MPCPHAMQIARICSSLRLQRLIGNKKEKETWIKQLHQKITLGRTSETHFFFSPSYKINHHPPLLIFSAEPITSPSALRFPSVESGVRLPSLIAAAPWLSDAKAACSELGGIA